MEIRDGVEAGTAGVGFVDDQRWTLGRVQVMLARLFHIGYTVRGAWKLLRVAWLDEPDAGAVGGRSGRECVHGMDDLVNAYHNDGLKNAKRCKHAYGNDGLSLFIAL